MGVYLINVHLTCVLGVHLKGVHLMGVANRPRFGCYSADRVCLSLQVGRRKRGVASKAGRASGVYRSLFHP